MARKGIPKPADGSKGMSIRKYAAHRKSLGLSGGTKAAVEKALKSGRIGKNDHGKIDPDQADLDWERNTTQQAPAPVPPPPPKGNGNGTHPGGSGQSTYSEARAQRETYTARLKRLDWLERENRLVDVHRVREQQFKLARATSDRILGVPQLVAEILITETDPDRIQDIIRRELEQALADLVNTWVSSPSSKSKG